MAYFIIRFEIYAKIKDALTVLADQRRRLINAWLNSCQNPSPFASPFFLSQVAYNLAPPLWRLHGEFKCGAQKCVSIIGPRKLLIFSAFRAPIEETPKEEKVNILIPKKKKKKDKS